MSHSRFLVSTAALASLLAACGGGGGSSSALTPPVNPSQQVASSPAASQPQATAAPAIQTSGTIQSIYANNSFLLQTGAPHGYITVSYDASTVFTGAKPFKGESVGVAANGSWSTSLQAVTVTQAGFASPTPAATAVPTPTPAAMPTPVLSTSGTVQSVYANNSFLIKQPLPHGYITVYYTSSTVFTPNVQPFKGEVISDIEATGSFSTSLNAISVTESGYATPTPQPTPVATLAPPPAVIPQHIATWAYDEYWSRGANGTAAQVRQYLTYAQGGDGNNKAVADCSGSGVCKSVFYFDPHMFYDTSVCGATAGLTASVLANSNESWFVHETGYSDKAHRIHGNYPRTCNGVATNVPVYEFNTLNPTVNTFFQSYLHTSAAGFDDFFMDDTSASVQSQFFGPGGGFCQDSTNANHYCTSTQEMATDADVVNEHVALATAMTHADGSAMQGVYNGLTFGNGYPTDLNLMQATNRFFGAVCENCVVNGGNYNYAMYSQVLNAMAMINTIPNASYVELSSGSSALGSAAQIGQRLTTTAMAWLGYADGHTIVWPDLEANTQNLEIFAENSIYPASPLQTMYSGARDLSVATGVWRREFGNCYNAGTFIGPCAAIVNSNSTAVTVSSSWLQQTYGHAVALTGGDIPSGGTMSLTSQVFTPNTTTIPAYQGILIVR